MLQGNWISWAELEVVDAASALPLRPLLHAMVAAGKEVSARGLGSLGFSLRWRDTEALGFEEGTLTLTPYCSTL